MELSTYRICRRGTDPIVAAAVHDGHDIRDDVAEFIALSSDERLREEDPFTGVWAQIAKTQIIGTRSRFEVDLNRPREKSVYLRPEDAWGLNLWKQPPGKTLHDRSLLQYDQFYESVKNLLDELVETHGKVVVYDLHTYNHRRDGAGGKPASPSENPEVNLGTGTLDRNHWGPLIDRFIDDLQAYDYRGRSLDVRENVKFKGGNFGRWIHENYPKTVCALSIEFKKFFMDEWTGEPDLDQVETIFDALASTTAGVRSELSGM